jgi:hypothetical protein
MLAAAAALVLTGCSSPTTSNEDRVASFVRSVRTKGYAEEYNDGALRIMARRVCDTLRATKGDDAAAERVLGDYSALLPTERAEIVDIARGTACK